MDTATGKTSDIMAKQLYQSPLGRLLFPRVFSLNALLGVHPRHVLHYKPCMYTIQMGPILRAMKSQSAINQ